MTYVKYVMIGSLVLIASVIGLVVLQTLSNSVQQYSKKKKTKK